MNMRVQPRCRRNLKNWSVLLTKLYVENKARCCPFQVVLRNPSLNRRTTVFLSLLSNLSLSEHDCDDYHGIKVKRECV